jgi:hypothetical protein
MSIDWDKFQKDIEDGIIISDGKTDKKLASKIASVTRLTDDEVRKLFPDPSDVKKVAELMEIVKRAGDRNDKINSIVTNAEKFGGIIFTLLGKLA